MAAGTVGVLRALLTADTSSFDAAMANASKKASLFSADFTKVGASAQQVGDAYVNAFARSTAAVDQFAKQFSGAGIAKTADETAAAVMRIGGAAKLTEGEQARVNAVMTEAIAKYKALGLEAPDHLKKIADATKGIHAPTDNLTSSVTKLAGAFGIALTGTAIITGLKTLAGKVFDTASAIHDQATALGFSTEAFQRNVYAAEQSGGSLEKFTTAANKLNDNLANGNDSTVASLAKAGLKFNEIRQMQPEQAWLKVTEAVGQMSDPMTRAAVAQDLFGKGALELLPGMIEGYEKLGKAASVMSEDTIDRLEAAQDAWDKFGRGVTIVAGETIGGLIRDFDLLRKTLGYLMADLQNPFVGLGQIMAEQDRKNAAAAQVVQDALTKTRGALDRFDIKVLDHTKTIDKAKTGTDVYAKAVQALADVYTGKRLAEEVQKVADAVTKAGGAEKITTAEGEKLTKQLREMETQGARLPPVLQLVISRFENWNTAGIKVQAGLGSILKILPSVSKAVQDDAAAWLKQEAAWAKTLGTVNGLSPSFLKLTAVNIKGWGHEGAVAADDLGKALSDLSAAFAQMSQIGGDSFGGITKGIGSVLGAFNLIVKGQDAIRDGFKNLGKNAVASYAQIIAGSTSVVSAMVLVGQAVLKAWGKEDAARELVRQLQVANNLAREFAQNASVSPGLVKTVEATEAALNHLMPHATAYERLLVHLAAEALHLTDIIDDLGGISATSLIQIQDRAARLFDLIKMGGATGAAATKQLNDVLQRMGQYFEDNGGIWDETFRNMVARAKELGIAVEGVNALLQGQQAKLVSGAVGVTDAIGKQAAKYEELKKAVEAAQKQGDPGELVKAQEALSKAVVVTQGEFDRLSRISLAAFNTLVASGVDTVSAMNQVGPGIDHLIASAKAFGLAGSQAFLELSRWRELTTANAALLSQIGSLNDLMVASANLGGLTADGFADLQAQGLSAYEKLTAAGLTSQEAEMAMKPLLESIIKLHEERGFAIDDETQKLIDQARQDGILKAKQIDTQKVLLDLVAALVVAVGGDLPESFKKLAEAGKNAAEDIADAFDKIDIKIPVEYQYSSTGDESILRHPNVDLPEFAGGTHGKFLNFGAGTPVMLHNWEQVVTQAETMLPQYGGSYRPSGVAMESTPALTGSDQPIIINHTTNLDGKAVARNQSRHLPKVLRHLQVTR